MAHRSADVQIFDDLHGILKQPQDGPIAARRARWTVPRVGGQFTLFKFHFIVRKMT